MSTTGPSHAGELRAPRELQSGPTDVQVRAVGRHVVRYADDADEVRELLGMLGLLGEPD